MQGYLVICYLISFLSYFCVYKQQVLHGLHNIIDVYHNLK